jgi:hypothetical protein
MPSGALKITGGDIPDNVKSDKQVEDEEVRSPAEYPYAHSICRGSFDLLCVCVCVRSNASNDITGAATAKCK